MPSRLKVVSLAAVAVVGLMIPLFGDPRVTPMTHALWARMLLRALEMDTAVKTSARASVVFDALSGRTSLSFPAEAYTRADGVAAGGQGTTRQVSAGDGVGEVEYRMAIVHSGDYVLRARVSGDPARPVSAEITPEGGAAQPGRTFSLVPAREPAWIVGGGAHLDPGTYTTSLLLPAGTSLESVEVAPPCVNPVEPIGGWKANAIVTSEDVAVTALRALDMEDALAPADTPIDRSGADFERDGVVPAAAGLEATVLKADANGVEAVLAVDLPEAGLYTLEGFVDAGEGQRWRADGCRKVVLCAGSPSGWRTVMTQSFSAGRHTFSVALTAGAAVERVRLTRRKEGPADYLAALRRLGFDPGDGRISRPTAIAAMEFTRQLHAGRAGRFCGEVADPRTLAPDAVLTTVAAAAPVGSGPSAPPATSPLSNALLPPGAIEPCSAGPELMPVFNPATNEVSAKIVYYGPGLSGKTTNLVWIHKNVASQSKSELLSLATEEDRTLFFDYLPVDMGLVRGLHTRLQIYTVPGQVFYESVRRMVLKGADAVVLVCDSQAAVLEHNIASFNSLRENIVANGLDPNLPLVIQYNKRDLPTAMSISALNAAVNPRGLFPFFEAVATQGTGVEETLKGITKWLFESLAELYASSPTPPTPESPHATWSSSVSAPREDTVPYYVPDADAGGDPPPRGGADLRPGQWVYLRDGKQQGPLELDDLIDLVLTSIPEDTKVWRPGLATWRSANEVTEISEHIPPPLGFAKGEDEDFPDFNSVPQMLRTALIADEDAAFRRILARPLAAQGFKIHEAKDGAEAWKIAMEQRLWLILANFDMAEIDGLEFCRRVRSSSLLRHTPLVFISDSDRYKDRYRAVQLGADDFLSKQTPIRELLIRIQLLMTRYSELDAAGQTGGGSGRRDESGALHGRIEVFGAPAVIQIIYQGALTGVFSARRQAQGGDAAVFGFRGGQIISAACQDKGGSEAVFAFLTWDRGQFDFIPGDPGAGLSIGNVEYLLFEGCRRLDELNRDGEAEPIV